MEMPHSSLYNLLVEGRYQDYEKNKMGTHPAVFLRITRACLKIKNCTKHVFLSPFHDRIKKKGAFICQDVMN
ncbi:hypothetical protein K310107B6_01800 [Mediterraneibacter gnavus]